MADEKTHEQLLDRIRELEDEVAEREKDLAHFRVQLQQANTRLEKLVGQVRQELKTAQAMQQILVPTQFPNIPGFEFSTKFLPSAISGGDYYDIFEHDDRFRFGLVLSSSSGHAMSALFLSVLLKLTGQLEARQGAKPHKVMQQIYKELSPNLDESSQADVFYGVVDRRSYTLSYVLAGGVVALHQPKATGEINMLDSGAGPLKKEFSTKLGSKEVSLNSRDRLVLCTKGLTECKNLDGEAYGIERLVKSFMEAPSTGVHELRNHILYAVKKFAGGKELERDLTLVAVEVKDRVIKLARN